MTVQFARKGDSIEFLASVEKGADRRLLRWGGVAGVAGALFMFGTLAVVTVLGLPDASDVETLTEYPDLAGGRIAEHFLYLGALVLFALHVLVLYRMLRPAHPAASLFGAATAVMGFITMAASSLLHVSTAPLSDLYVAADAADRAAIEAAWVGAQSVFDAMLATGVLLVPIGLLLLGLAMRSFPAIASSIMWLTIGIAAVGVIGAVIAIIDPGSMFAAISVLGMTVVLLATGWQMLRVRAGMRELVG
jgi:hypothetical protein